MSNYSKLFGSLIGSALGLGAAFGVDMDWMTPQVQGGLIGVMSLIGTFAAPANKTK